MPTSSRALRVTVRVVGKKTPRIVTRDFDSSDFPNLEGVPADKFSVVLLDPPFRYSRTVGSGVAENHYATMTDKDIASLPINTITKKNAMMFFWCSGPTLNRALALIEGWGFDFKTIAYVWVKTNKVGDPSSMGLGHYTRPGSELVLLAGKGRAAPLVKKRNNQVFLGKRRSHSEKPDEFRDLIDSLTGHDPRLEKIELFSRKTGSDSWSSWGNQIGKLG